MQQITAQEWIDTGNYFTRPNGQKVFYHKQGCGSPIVMLHGFPTWSYDYSTIADDLQQDFEVISFDFIGYGASDKPRKHNYCVGDSADLVQELLRYLGINEFHIVMHDYGGIVGQELLDRYRKKQFSGQIKSVSILNCGVIYKEYRPTFLQKLLATPILGRIVAASVSREKVHGGLNKVRGVSQLNNSEFEQLWQGISRKNGHKLSHRHIGYNAERAVHAERWEDALYVFSGPIQLIWGMSDPVSGSRILNSLLPLLTRARVTELSDVGHFPQSEAPEKVAETIRNFISTQ